MVSAMRQANPRIQHGAQRSKNLINLVVPLLTEIPRETRKQNHWEPSLKSQNSIYTKDFLAHRKTLATQLAPSSYSFPWSERHCSWTCWWQISEWKKERRGSQKYFQISTLWFLGVWKWKIVKCVSAQGASKRQEFIKAVFTDKVCQYVSNISIWNGPRRWPIAWNAQCLWQRNTCFSTCCRKDALNQKRKQKCARYPQTTVMCMWNKQIAHIPCEGTSDQRSPCCKRKWN